MRAPIKEIEPSLSVHMHHSEAVDPTLVRWINELLHELLGWGPWTFVAVFGLAIVAIPVWLIYTSLRNMPPPEPDSNHPNDVDADEE